MALLAMAIKNLGHEAQSFTGSQAGVITDSVHNKARIIDVTPGPDPYRARRGQHRDRRRLPGRVPGQEGHHHPGPRRLGHHRRRAGRRAGRRGLRDLHRRGRRLHRRPAGGAARPARSTGSRYEDMLELAASGSKVLLHRCVEYARRYNIPIHVRSSFSGLRGTWVSNEPQGDQPMEQAIISGVAHDTSEAKVTVVGVPGQAGRGRDDLPRHRGRRDQHRHGGAERLGRLHRADRHLLHPAEDRGPQGDRGAGAGAGRASASTRCATTTRSPRSRWSAPG